MKYFLKVLLILVVSWASGQNKSTEAYGFKHLNYVFKDDKVDILVKSRKGEEHIKKPLFFFCQGSLPQPLIKYDSLGIFGVFPFSSDSITKKYHLVIVSKPFIPVVSDVNTLGRNFTYTDKTGNYPKAYSDRNYLNYYANRNIELIKYLIKQNWVSSKKVVVAGHSEGSTIAAKMASISPLITHLIYSGGNPLGRIMSIIQQSRASENDTLQMGEDEIKYWQYVAENQTSKDVSQGDSPKTTFDFSIPPIRYLEKLTIPVLVCYGTKDWSSPYNDFLRVDFIRKKKKNFTFKAYIGTEHNYFPLNSDNKPNYERYNWDNVANDWLKWLNQQ